MVPRRRRGGDDTKDDGEEVKVLLTRRGRSERLADGEGTAAAVPSPRRAREDAAQSVSVAARAAAAAAGDDGMATSTSKGADVADEQLPREDAEWTARMTREGGVEGVVDSAGT